MNRRSFFKSVAVAVAGVFVGKTEAAIKTPDYERLDAQVLGQVTMTWGVPATKTCAGSTTTDNSTTYTIYCYQEDL